jgi:polyhydroxyalkanoate synthase subunit PhaC
MNMVNPHNASAPHEPATLDVPLKLGLARVTSGLSPASQALAYADWLAHLLLSVSKQTELLISASRKNLLWQQYAANCWHPQAGKGIQPASNDKRFLPHEWTQPPFNALAQAFLSQQQWWSEAMTGVRGVSRYHEDVVDFSTRQCVDMASPSNFIGTNPEVLKATLLTGGQNLVAGLANWWSDMVAFISEGRPHGADAFLPGRSVAVTPGKVVFRTRLMELIQYEPMTAQVGAEPILIVPSCIMKFYILDLTPEDSLVKFLVAHGHTVFLISWKNPVTEDRDLGMDDYVSLGVLAAVKEVQALTNHRGIHAMGYCLGGTFLAIAAAWLAKKPRNPLRTITLLAAETDFHEPGQLGLFINESQITFLEDLMAEHGYIDGQHMAGAFLMLNSKDLVWSKVVHEYLMGSPTPMTPLRAWNTDSTRLPARMHSEYLRRLYLHNDLALGRYRFGGEVVPLSNIRVPLFVVATERDHIAPWRSVFKIHQLTHAPVEFVLCSGGHNVGIVNPPDGPLKNAHSHYLLRSSAADKASPDPQAWLDGAREVEGSWWPGWQRWLDRHSSGRVASKAPRPLAGDGAGAAAPGSYVLQE